MKSHKQFIRKDKPLLLREFSENWNNYYKKWRAIIADSVPSAAMISDEVAVGYWQWASSYMTLEKNGLSPEPSVTKIMKVINGFPEIAYFYNDYLMKEISDENKKNFEDIKFYNSKSTDNGNFESLFAKTSLPLAGAKKAATKN